MIKKYFRRKACLIVESDANILRDVDKYMCDYFECIDNYVVDNDCWHIMLTEDVNRYVDMGLQKIILKQISEPDIQVFFDGTKKKIGILKENSYDWQKQNLLRMIRVVLRLQCQEMATIFLHGGCISYRDIGVCFLGNKKSGKTSSLLSFLKYKKSYFISNDDVSLYKKSNDWYAEGWPRSIVIRNDTWKKLGLHSNKLTHPLNVEKKGICLYPKQISEMFGKKFLKEINIKYIVFPKFIDTNEAEIVQLDSTEGKKRLSEQVLVNPGKYNEYLLPFFNKKNILIPDELIDNLIFLELRQNFNDLENGTDVLAKRIDKDFEDG